MTVCTTGCTTATVLHSLWYHEDIYDKENAASKRYRDQERQT